MGCMFDWSREVATSDPAYYRWTQWLFVQFFKAGLAYRAKAAVDWCPKDLVVLAREQVEGAERRCWRCGTPVIKRDLEQWFFRITNYADELLSFDGIDWPEPIRLMQTNWIGRSEGAEIEFPVDGAGDERIRVFTTRPDTVFGATFMVLAPEHPLVSVLDHRRAAGRGGGVRRPGRPGDRDRPPERGAREERRLHRRACHQPDDQRADPDLDRRLRAARLWHRRDHGGPRPRRA